MTPLPRPARPPTAGAIRPLPLPLPRPPPLPLPAPRPPRNAPTAFLFVNCAAFIAFILVLRTSSTVFLSSVKRNIPVKVLTLALGSTRRGPIMLIISIFVLIDGVISTIAIRSSEQKRYGSLRVSKESKRSSLSLQVYQQIIYDLML